VLAHGGHGRCTPTTQPHRHPAALEPFILRPGFSLHAAADGGVGAVPSRGLPRPPPLTAHRRQQPSQAKNRGARPGQDLQRRYRCYQISFCSVLRAGMQRNNDRTMQLTKRRWRRRSSGCAKCTSSSRSSWPPPAAPTSPPPPRRPCRPGKSCSRARALPFDSGGGGGGVHAPVTVSSLINFCAV
jgi:hypothetical protein